MPDFLKKLIAILLLVGFIFPLNIHLPKNEIIPKVETTKTAHAAVPVWELNPAVTGSELTQAAKETAGLIEWIKTAFETAKTAINTLDIFNLEWWIQNVFKIALEYFKLMVLNMMTDQIMSWINGTNSSGPQFITDWTDFLAKGASQARDSVISLIDQTFFAGKLCAPFALPIRNFFRTPGQNYPPLNLQISCTLDQIVANVQAFYNNFANGGFAGYSSLIQPENNYYGNLIQIMDYDAVSKAAAEKAKENEGLASQGYIGVKRCNLEEVDYETGEPTGNCLSYEITSPGKVAAGAVDRAVGNRFDYIVNAEQIVTIVAIVVDGFINKLIGSGINGLLGYFSGTVSNPNTSTVFSQNLLQNSAGGGFVGQNQVPNGNLSNCNILPAGPTRDACVSASANQSTQAFITTSIANTSFAGQEVHIYWTSINATSCTSSQFPTGGSTSGSFIDFPQVGTTYSVTCTGPSGSNTASVSVTVNGNGLAPVTITASPNPVSSGAAATLSWTIGQGVSICTANFNNGALITSSGSQSTGPLTSPQTYTIDCNMISGGTSRASVTVLVGNPPTITLMANGITRSVTIPSGSSATLSWNTTNANSCTASGDWSGSKPISSGVPGTFNWPSTSSWNATANGFSTPLTLKTDGTGSIFGEALNSVVLNNSSVSFVRPNSGNSQSYGGTLNSAGTDLTGTFTQANGSGLFDWSASVSGSPIPKFQLVSTGPLTSNKTYVLQCSGNGGTSSASVSVTVF